VVLPGGGATRIADFQNTADTIELDRGLWGGGLTEAQVLAQFASAVPGGVLFDFGGGNTILVQGVDAPAALAGQILPV
jgi:hypothetical protein